MSSSSAARRLLLLGTKKGVFIGRGDSSGRRWSFSGPHCAGTWSFYAVIYDQVTGTIYAGGQSNWYGAAVWWSADLGETWQHSSEGLAYPNGPSIEQVWCVRPVNGALYAGVDPAGLFKSEDGGRTWAELTSIRTHPSSKEWYGTNGGMPLHAVWPQTQDGSRMLVAISAGGVYRTRDGGRTWDDCDVARDPCVHALVGGTDDTPGAAAPLYQQNHAGVFRSQDGGASWVDASAGLPSRFGFPLAVHPRDPKTVYAVPLQSALGGQRHVSDDGMAVWRTRDGGTSWQRLSEGLPQGRTFLTVLRGALAVDQSEPAGVFCGTPTGQLFGSVDEGETWFDVTRGLPPIYAVACAAV